MTAPPSFLIKWEAQKLPDGADPAAKPPVRQARHAAVGVPRNERHIGRIMVPGLLGPIDPPGVSVRFVIRPHPSAWGRWSLLLEPKPGTGPIDPRPMPISIHTSVDEAKRAAVRHVQSDIEIHEARQRTVMEQDRHAG